MTEKNAEVSVNADSGCDMEKSVFTKAGLLTAKCKENAKTALALREKVSAAKKNLQEFENDADRYEKLKTLNEQYHEELSHRRKLIQNTNITLEIVDKNLQKNLSALLVQVNTYLEREKDINICFSVNNANYHKFANKWMDEWLDGYSSSVQQVRTTLEENVKKAEKEYEAQTEKMGQYVKEMQQNAADAYCKKRQEYDDLVEARQLLDKEIAEKQEKMKLCTEMGGKSVHAFISNQ